MSYSFCTSDYLSNWIDTLAACGGGEDPLTQGVTRPGWSALEHKAIQMVEREACAHGATARYDSVGNLYLRFTGSSDAVIQIGSHLDTVPQGGRFDGVVGIVCGLAAMLEYSNTPLSKSLELVIWRGEESATFGVACAGSRAACGILPAATLQREYQGRSLKTCIEDCGYSSKAIQEEAPIFTLEEQEKVLAHLELHIEQGTVLETMNKDIGIVTAIRGNRRMEVHYRGEAGHSGATPMGLPYRKDANLGAAYALVRLHERTKEFIDQGHDLVTTCGVLNSNHQYNSIHELMQSSSITRISPYAYFSFDARSTSDETLDAFEKIMHDCVHATAEEFSLECTVQSLTPIAPVPSLSSSLQSLAEEAVSSLELQGIRMPCGAGHDCAILAANTDIDVCLLFIPCRAGISHNPEEYASAEQLTHGARTLHALLKKLSED